MIIYFEMRHFASLKTAASLRAHYSGKHRETHAAYRKRFKGQQQQEEEEGPLEFPTQDGGYTTTPPDWIAANYHMMDEQVNGCRYEHKHKDTALYTVANCMFFVQLHVQALLLPVRRRGGGHQARVCHPPAGGAQEVPLLS